MARSIADSDLRDQDIIVLTVVRDEHAVSILSPTLCSKAETN
ncbi:MAG: hypothetical protein R2688_05720 [Fimbriimonadaceae bacterium]